MSPPRAFSKVYQDVRTDRRFREVYYDDAAFALWVRLLLQANDSWPSAAPIPRSTKARPLALLVEVGLVRLVGTDEYRIHGLDPGEAAEESPGVPRGPGPMGAERSRSGVRGGVLTAMLAAFLAAMPEQCNVEGEGEREGIQGTRPLERVDPLRSWRPGEETTG